MTKDFCLVHRPKYELYSHYYSSDGPEEEWTTMQNAKHTFIFEPGEVNSFSCACNPKIEPHPTKALTARVWHNII